MMTARSRRRARNDLYDLGLGLSFTLATRLENAGFRSQAELAATPFHVVRSRADLRGVEATAVERVWTRLNLNNNGPQAA